MSILLADARKTFLDQKSRKKTTALRKGLTLLPNISSDPNVISSEPSTSKAPAPQRACSKRRAKTVIVQYPCGKCGKECHDTDCVECSLCETWFHYACLNLNGNEYFLTNENIDYYCPDCDIESEKPVKSKPKKRKM